MVHLLSYQAQRHPRSARQRLRQYYCRYLLVSFVLEKAAFPGHSSGTYVPEHMRNADLPEWHAAPAVQPPFLDRCQQNAHPPMHAGAERMEKKASPGG
jgi:hypothetical protein